MTRNQIHEAVGEELYRAYLKHGIKPWSRHEFAAILREEFDELWEVIKADEPEENIRLEAIQVAAMAIRYLETSSPDPK